MQVKVVNLKRHFGKTKAVDDISFHFAEGQIVGFVGPNGAGKTTTMQIISTLDTPTDGDIYLDNISVVQYPEKARRLVGFMPDSLPMHRDITVDDYLDFFARAFGIRCNRRHMVVEGIEEFTNLLGIREKFLKELSKGMKQRVSLARALIHDPGVLVLDEPAAGLDPRARIELRELLRALSDQNKAVLISSHILSELAEICNSAVIIENGKLLKAGTLSEIAQKQSHCTVLIRTIGIPNDLYKKMLQTPMILDARIVGNGVEVEIEGSENNTADLVELLVNDGYKIIEVKHVRAGLEDIFMDVTKGDLN